MAYTIRGSEYKQVAGRQFAAGKGLNIAENKGQTLPFVQHAVQHIRSGNFNIVHMKADFQQDVQVLNAQDIGHVSLHFQLNGNSQASFKGIKGAHPLQSGEYNMYYANEFDTNLYFKAQKNYEYLAVTLKKEYLQRLLQQYGHPVKQLEKLLHADAPFALTDKPMPLSQELNLALYALTHTPIADNLSEMFIDAKISEIIALQLSQYTGATAAAHPPAYKQLEEVYHFIQQHFLTIHSLEELARQFPLSETQIKNGLKTQYNTTLYALVHRKRMLYAAELLKNTSMNVNEIAWEIGYSNATNFIQAFRKTFHTTPKQLKTT